MVQFPKYVNIKVINCSRYVYLKTLLHNLHFTKTYQKNVLIHTPRFFLPLLYCLVSLKE